MSAPTPNSDSSDSNSAVSLSASSNNGSDTSHDSTQGKDGVGLSNAELGKKRRYALDLVNRLHNTGVQTDIDLPQIAVIGNQSAGKSSLIEAISGITLPRASGTCTRCPTECRLKYSPQGKWNCVVRIRTITDSVGQSLGQARNELFGEVIYDKGEVEERIRRAQRAILHPHIPRQQVLMGDDETDEGKGLTFSSNCVSLEISGPDVADLSFCDLPGLIRSTSGKEGTANDIQLVQGLVESYIKKPSCIILLTISCETDPQNQGALQLARDYDPKGLRTVGVLTKPDRIGGGDEEDWVAFVKNETHELLNNWFCVKQPNSNELREGITWKEARDRENEFFAMRAPWCDLDPMYQRYLRTANLVERLSEILSGLISKRLPEIHKELQQIMQKTREDLNRLPKEPSRDPLSDISTMIHKFSVDLSKVLEGTPEHDGLLQSIRPAQETFKKDIRKTAPQFRPYEKRYASVRTMPKLKFLNQDEGEGEEQDDDCVDEFSGQMVNRHSDHFNRPIYVDEVFRRIQNARTRELPGKYPYVVEECLIRQATEQWLAPSYHLCEVVHRMTLEHVKKLVQKHFAEFGQGLLERQARLIVEKHMEERFEATKDRIKWLLDLEVRPFTLNTHYLADYREKFYSYYKGCREQDLNQELSSSLLSLDTESRTKHFVGLTESAVVVNEALASLVKVGLTGLKPSDLLRLIPADEMEPALAIMADIRAYFQVAYKRFVDNIPLAIDHEMVRGFERDLLNIVFSNLGIHGANGSEICMELARESPQVAARREEMVKKLDRMRAGSEELSRIF